FTPWRNRRDHGSCGPAGWYGQYRGLSPRRIPAHPMGIFFDGGTQRITLGADKGYDRHGLVQDLRDRNVTPHVARKRKGSAIDGRTTRHAGYAMSIHVRRRIESIFGWLKTIGGVRKTRFGGLERVGLHFSLAATAYHLLRISRLGVA
ncbi:MAG: transposase, partial [Acidithiobacillus sp.]